VLDLRVLVSRSSVLGLHNVTLTPAQRIAVLQASVQNLVSAGSVLPAAGQSLQAKLEAAKSAAAAGSARDAIGSLTAFENQVRALVKTGRLDAAQGTALTSTADKIIAQLRAG
jgi:hypothetical protein